MASLVEDYGLLGDTQTAALVGRDGSIDWLCFPRFDGGAVFAALLGTEQHGRWLLAPAGTVVASRRRYQGDTLILETEMDTEDGTVRLVDFMPPRGAGAGRRPHRRGRDGPGADADGTAVAVRLRAGRALGPQGRRCARRGRRPGLLLVADPGGNPRRGPDHRRRVHRRAG